MTVPHFKSSFASSGGAALQNRAEPYRRSGRSRGSRKALCLWLPTFELRLELVRSPELDATSVALLAQGESTRREIWQVSERASFAGVEQGQLISEAVGLCPSLTLLEPDPAHYSATVGELTEAISEVSPIVEPAEAGRIYVGMDGLERLYGPPENQVRKVYEALLRVFPRPLVAATRVGMAPGKFGAWVAAVSSRPGRPCMIAEDGLQQFLRSQSVSALPVDAIIIQRLKRLGIQTLGALSSFREPSLIRQFGLQGRDMLAWATGQRVDIVRATYQPKPIRAALDFPLPIGQIETLHGALVRLLERALARPARRSRGIVGVRMGARLEEGGSWAAEVILKEPAGSPEPIARPLKAKMAITPPPRAVESFFVEFFRYGPSTSQAGLFDRKEANGRAADGRVLTSGSIPTPLRNAIRELKLRIGYSPLYRVVEMDPWSRIPERRHALLNFDP
ncbi:MAG: DNA polymerase Y family protein [Longimicrobiales bacterium]